MNALKFTGRTKVPISVPIPHLTGSQESFTIMPISPVVHNSLGAVIGIAVLGTLVVALIALFIGYRQWQKGKEHEHLAVAYSTGRLDGSDYVMPGELGSGGLMNMPPMGCGVGEWRASGRGPPSVYLALVFVLQMSLRAIVTTTPTPATTHCLSVLLTPRPLTRSVH